MCESGCLYLCAWGVECEQWHDSADWAHLDQSDYKEVPEEKLVVTTWHENESLEDFFFFVRVSAAHPVVDLRRTVIIHIADQDRESELCAYLDAV